MQVTLLLPAHEALRMHKPAVAQAAARCHQPGIGFLSKANSTRAWEKLIGRSSLYRFSLHLDWLWRLGRRLHSRARSRRRRSAVSERGTLVRRVWDKRWEGMVPSYRLTHTLLPARQRRLPRQHFRIR